MTSRKDKKPTLDGTGDLTDLLLNTGPAGPGEASLADLLGPKLDVEDPIGEIEYENLTNEQAVEKETSAVLAAFKDRAKKEQERFELVTDSEFWFAACFQTRA